MLSRESGESCYPVYFMGGFSMKVLFIGGTGNISTDCVSLAVEKGIQLSILTRGQTSPRFSDHVEILRCDIRDLDAAREALRGREFDAVVDFIAYLPEHVEADIALFQNRTRQYVFISSASAYEKPPSHYLITEAVPLSNPFWLYARQKIACERRLDRAFGDEGFPATIVRPSHTYGVTRIPSSLSIRDYTLIDRMKRGKKILVHGDGQSLWVLTHTSDFAKGLVGILGQEEAVGDHYHITSDEVLTWDQIYRELGKAAGVEPELVHVPSDVIARFDPELGANLLGDKSFSVVYDNSKIKKRVPGFQATTSFAEGLRKSLAWFEADPARMIPSAKSNDLIERVLSAWSRV
jgi:nucleoside-diphosphate-sugar epimerase